MNKIKRITRTLLIIVFIGISLTDFIKTKVSVNDSLIENVKDKFSFITAYSDKYDEILAKENDTGKLHKVNLVRVVDGDTIIVSENTADEIRVRLIGIDTPESVNPDESKNNEYGELASAYTKNLLENVSYVYLEYDSEETDTYGRTLAYVWLNDTENAFDTEEIKEDMLNAIIVENGYALAKEYPPNTMYANILEDLESEAKVSETGLWADAEFVQLVGE